MAKCVTMMTFGVHAEFRHHLDRGAIVAVSAAAGGRSSMATIRDRFGHFLPRQTQAGEADPGEGEVAEDDAVDLVPENPRELTQRLGDELGLLRDHLAETHARRQDLLLDGDIAELEAVDAEIRRLELARESIGIRLDATYPAVEVFDQDHRRQAWQALRPRFEAAHAERDRLAYELWQAIDQAAAVEAEAEALGVEISDRSPPAAPLTRYLWEQWATAHAIRLGLMPRQAA
jgi:hypothetical protein